MFGFDNISAHNGWAIAMVGVCIVFTGLTLLSLAISQLHKILDMWETKKRPESIGQPEDFPSLPDKDTVRTRPLMPRDQETVRQYKLLVDRLNQPFSLPKLLELAGKVGLEKPHSTVNQLLKKKIIVPDNNGYFIWKH